MNRRIAASSVDRSCWQDGWEAHADDMRVEFVPGCGHFIADERPELVLDRALELFAAD